MRMEKPPGVTGRVYRKEMKLWKGKQKTRASSAKPAPAMWKRIGISARSAGNSSGILFKFYRLNNSKPCIVRLRAAVRTIGEVVREFYDTAFGNTFAACATWVVTEIPKFQSAVPAIRVVIANVAIMALRASCSHFIHHLSGCHHTSRKRI